MIVGMLSDLRPVRASDLALLRQWEQDPHIADSLGIRASALDSRETAEQEFDRLLRTPRVKLLVIQTKDGQVVGFLRLHELDMVARKATLRVFVAPEAQGQGLGTDALRTVVDFCFRELGLHRLGLVVREDNQRAARLYERLGFSVEGRERDALWACGRWVSFLHLGLLAGEQREEDN